MTASTIDATKQKNIHGSEVTSANINLTFPAEVCNAFRPWKELEKSRLFFKGVTESAIHEISMQSVIFGNAIRMLRCKLVNL